LLWLLGAATPIARAAPDLQTPTVITICHGGGCDYDNIQDAVGAAGAGGVTGGAPEYDNDETDEGRVFVYGDSAADLNATVN